MLIIADALFGICTLLWPCRMLRTVGTGVSRKRFAYEIKILHYYSVVQDHTVPVWHYLPPWPPCG